MSLKRFSDIIDFQTLEPVDLLNAMFAVADQEQDEEKVHAAIQRIKELLPSDQPKEEEKAVLSKKALRRVSPAYGCGPETVLCKTKNRASRQGQSRRSQGVPPGQLV